MKLIVNHHFRKKSKSKPVDSEERRQLWLEGETRACSYLVDLGYAIIERNWRTRMGELDIVAHDLNEGRLVFIEVRTLKTSRYVRPELTVTAKKQQRIVRLAESWVRQRAPRVKIPMCFDVIGIAVREETLTHLRSAFSSDIADPNTMRF